MTGAVPMLLLPALLLGAILLGFVALAPAGGGQRQLVRRARALGKAGLPSAGPAAGALVRRQGETALDSLAQRFLPRPAILRTRLEATGKAITIGQYGAACVVVMVLNAALALLLHTPPLLALLSALATGLWLPHMVVGLLMARRRARFFKVFAEAIGLIVRGLRAGLPVTETISVVGREISDPVGEEFRTIADQVRLGRPLEEAMWQVGKRLDLPEFNFLVISLSVQRETGGNLAETLENLEAILRKRQQMRLKIKAMSSEATASALIIGSLPFIMGVLMSVVSPDYLSTLFTDPFGRLMLAGGGASLLIGAIVMRQMVRFEI